MADCSVVARDELHECEASQSWMFCFRQYFPGKALLRCRSGVLHFALHKSFCVHKYYYN